MPILMLGCKGLLLQMQPFPLIEKRFREKNFCVVHASKSLTYGKDTKRILHVAEVADGVSVSENTRYNSLLYRYRKQIPVYDSTYNTF